AATVLRERLGLRRGDRVATVLFNHDQTVFVYFAVWTLGVAVVPINVEESTEKKRYILEHSEASVVFCWQDSLDEIRSLLGGLPIHHVNGTVVALVTPFYFGGGAVLNRKFKSSVFWRRIHDEGVTCVSVVPTLLEFLLDADEDLKPYRLDRFRGVICGAGPLLKETAARFEDRFRFPIRHGYGLSETTCYSCFLPNDLPAGQRRRWLTEYDFPSI